MGGGATRRRGRSAVCGAVRVSQGGLGTPQWRWPVRDVDVTTPVVESMAAVARGGGAGPMQKRPAGTPAAHTRAPFLPSFLMAAINVKRTAIFGKRGAPPPPPPAGASTARALVCPFCARRDSVCCHASCRCLRACARAPTGVTARARVWGSRAQAAAARYGGPPSGPTGVPRRCTPIQPPPCRLVVATAVMAAPPWVPRLVLPALQTPAQGMGRSGARTERGPRGLA